MTVEILNKDNFEQTVLHATSGPVVVDFWAEWCGPCKIIAPLLNEIAIDLKGQVKIAKLNIDENPEFAVRFGIRSIPTLLLFMDGEKIADMTGLASKSQLKEWIKISLRSDERMK